MSGGNDLRISFGCPSLNQINQKVKPSRMDTIIDLLEKYNCAGSLLSNAASIARNRNVPSEMLYAKIFSPPPHI